MGRWLSRLHIGLLMSQYVNRIEYADGVDVPLFVKFERVGGDAIGCACLRCVRVIRLRRFRWLICDM